jgi:hypothetical protein
MIRPRRCILGPATRLRRRNFGLLLAVLALAAVFPRRAPAQEPPNAPLYLGETLRYTMTIMGVTGGELVLSAKRVQWEGQPAYKFEMSALSNEFLSKIFLVRDYMASWVDPRPFQSLRFEMHTVEGKRVRDDLIEFDYAAGVAKRGGKEIALDGPTLDSLSSVYYIRTLDLNSGKPIEIDVISRKRFSLRVEMQGRETVATPVGTFRTIRIEPKIVRGEGLIGKGQNLVLWVTDDENKLPVQLRSKLKVGTLVGKLKAIEKQ